ncbi:hypothetical protein [Synechococcus sp. PCC 7336]|nr:hypothetical protein [Synechococcus sp. PCC 7336]
MKELTESQWVGIDVSQSCLDIAVRPADEHWQPEFDAEGVFNLGNSSTA